MMQVRNILRCRKESHFTSRFSKPHNNVSVYRTRLKSYKSCKMEQTGVYSYKKWKNSERGSGEKVCKVKTRVLECIRVITKECNLCKHSANITINEDKACWLYFALGSKSCCTYHKVGLSAL